MSYQWITRGQAMCNSPKLHKILFVLAVDALTSACLITWEHAHRIRHGNKPTT